MASTAAVEALAHCPRLKTLCVVSEYANGCAACAARAHYQQRCAALRSVETCGDLCACMWRDTLAASVTVCPARAPLLSDSSLSHAVRNCIGVYLLCMRTRDRSPCTSVALADLCMSLTSCAALLVLGDEPFS